MPEAQDPTSNEVHAAAEKVRQGMTAHDPDLREEGLKVIRRAGAASGRRDQRVLAGTLAEAKRRGVSPEEVPGGAPVIDKALRERRAHVLHSR